MLIQITNEEFRLLCDFIRSHTGMILGEDKKYLLETRLSKLLSEYGLNNYLQLFKLVSQQSDYKLYNRFIDLVTTHETSFFRDSKPFILLQNHLLKEHFNKKSSLKILSAACATGQEVYSIAIIISELLGQKIFNYDVKIHGVDISDHEIMRASKGVYSEFEVKRGLPENYLHKYFHSDGKCWKVNDQLRFMATFKKGNLLESASWSDYYDFIFCRNIAIYLSSPNRMKLFEQISLHTQTNGILIIGSTETLDASITSFKAEKALNTYFYRKS